MDRTSPLYQIDARLGEEFASNHFAVYLATDQLLKILLLAQWIIVIGLAALQTHLSSLVGVEMFPIQLWVGFLLMGLLTLFPLWTNHKRFQYRLRQSCRSLAVLEQTNNDLDSLLWSRTKNMKLANRQLQQAVKARVRAETEREKLLRKLYLVSRQADLSEVATGVLHSVGNVINSVNLSSEIILERINRCRLDRLDEAVHMLQRSPAELADFLRNDHRGKHLPSFFRLTNEQLKAQYADIKSEIVTLRNHVAHVSEVISMQQSYARVTNDSEEISIDELCESAIRIHQAAISSHEIEIVRDFDELPVLRMEKHKVFRIMVNLISNAIHAIASSDQDKKRITVCAAYQEPGSLILTVSDTGIGITDENIKRIFQHGFSTRIAGNGFGLHSSLLAAHALDGRLECSSDGAGCGATFVLTIPVSTASHHPRGMTPHFKQNIDVRVPFVEV